jgi:hypothetical protein
MLKITVIRSFSRTKQISSFEPINAHCSVQLETDIHALDDTIIRSYSEHLDKLVRQEVERTIETEMEKVKALKKSNEF